MDSHPATPNDTAPPPPNRDKIMGALDLAVEAEAVAQLVTTAIAGMEASHATLHAAAAAVARLAGMAVTQLSDALDTVIT